VVEDGCTLMKNILFEEVFLSYERTSCKYCLFITEEVLNPSSLQGSEAKLEKRSSLSKTILKVMILFGRY
jgi:hypothetical protein